MPCELHIPFGAITGFADPHIRFGLQFHPEQLPDEPEEAEPEAPPPAPEPEAPKSETPQVVSLDAFRRRTTPRE